MCQTMFKSDGQAIMAGITGICGAGGVIAMLWFNHISDRVPKTFSPGWQKATAKYRASQMQDPISGNCESSGY